MKYITSISETQFTIDVNQQGEITLNGEVINVDMQQMAETTMYSIIVDGKSHDVRLSQGEGAYIVQLGGQIFEVVVEDERTRRLAGLRSSSSTSTGEAIIKAPMPGVVVDVLVEPGQRVTKGEIVVVLESMKMQNEFKAPRDGTVHNVRIAPGDKIDQNTVMVTLV